MRPARRADRVPGDGAPGVRRPASGQAAQSAPPADALNPRSADASFRLLQRAKRGCRAGEKSFKSPTTHAAAPEFLNWHQKRPFNADSNCRGPKYTAPASNPRAKERMRFRPGHGPPVVGAFLRLCVAGKGFPAVARYLFHVMEGARATGRNHPAACRRMAAPRTTSGVPCRTPRPPLTVAESRLAAREPGFCLTNAFHKRHRRSPAPPAQRPRAPQACRPRSVLLT